MCRGRWPGLPPLQGIGQWVLLSPVPAPGAPPSRAVLWNPSSLMPSAQLPLLGPLLRREGEVQATSLKAGATEGLVLSPGSPGVGA